MELYDLSYIPKRKYGDVFRYDWQHSIGYKIGVRINNNYTYYTIISYDTKTGDMVLSDNYGNKNTLNRWIFKSHKKDVAANKITKEHLFEENTEVNGYYIIKKIRVPHPTKKSCTIKGYTVKCLKCEEIEKILPNIVIN